jgi:hypothetical protein
MKLRQILQGLVLVVACFSSGTCLCAAYYALVAKSEANSVRDWVIRHPGSWWVEGEDRVLVGMERREAADIPGGARAIVFEAAAPTASVYFLQGAGPLGSGRGAVTKSRVKAQKDR